MGSRSVFFFRFTYTERKALALGGSGGPAERCRGKHGNADRHGCVGCLLVHIQQVELWVVVGLNTKPHEENCHSLSVIQAR